MQKTKCTVTAVNITEDDIGFYNLTLENSMGSLTMTFYLQRYGKNLTFNVKEQLLSVYVKIKMKT